jgi:hypothetical protein
LADGGLTLHHCGYAENIAHAVLLAVDHPDAAADRSTTAVTPKLTLRQVIDASRTSIIAGTSSRSRTNSPPAHGRWSGNRRIRIACSI